MSAVDLITLASVAVVVLTAVAALVVSVRTRATRVEPGPATLDLGPETPAVVDLVTDDWRVTELAPVATIVDLAARRWFTIEQAGSDQVVIRLRARDGDGPLAAYEQRVLDLVEDRAIDGVVPASALTTGSQSVSSRWHRSFRSETVAHAQRLGLSEDRYTRSRLGPVWLGATVAAGLAILASEHRGGDFELSPLGLAWLVTVTASIGLMSWATSRHLSGEQRDTEAGRMAAGRWMGVRAHMVDVGSFEDKPATMVALWDRHLAHAVALDLAPLTVSQLPLRSERHHRGWSPAARRWRQIRIRYPRLRPGYGQHPVGALLGALVAGAAAVVAMRALLAVRRGDIGPAVLVSDNPEIGAVVTFWMVVAGLVLAWNVLKVLAAVVDITQERQIEGVLVRRRVRTGWFELSEMPLPPVRSRGRERFFVAVDAGVASTVKAWRVRRGIYSGLEQGKTYRVRVTPLLGHVRAVTPVATEGDPRVR